MAVAKISLKNEMISEIQEENTELIDRVEKRVLELCRSNLKGELYCIIRHIFHILTSFRLCKSIVQTSTACMVVINSFLVIWYLCLEFTETTYTYLLVIMKLPTHYIKCKLFRTTK